MRKLTIQEIDTLIEALEAWEVGDRGGNLMSRLITHMISQDNEELGNKLNKVDEKKEKEEEEAKYNRKEVATLLKAKLIEMKRELVFAGLREDL